jgi:Flp pilus assembly pilin Flp
MKNQNKKKKSGQAMVEYIIIVVIVAIAAIAIFGAFSDRLRGMLSAATEELGGDGGDVGTSSVELMQGIGE